jgi:hypothetical protein
VSTIGGRLWLKAAVACFALTTLPCQALDIGRAAVNSKIGEPLNAHVRIRLAPGERLDNSCLSAGSRDDFPEPDHVLITDVQLSLFTSQNAIRIFTTRPVNLPAVSMALRVRCPGGPLIIRALNLYLNPRSSEQPSTNIPIVSSLPGSSIAVRSGDTVYGFARIIFPKNEKAVGELALAIALANPTLFPDGKPRRLRVGERVTIPDLRTVQRIVADSGISPDSVFPPSPKARKSRTAASRSKRSKAAVRSVPPAANSSARRAKPSNAAKKMVVRPIGDRRSTVRRTGQLGLILALSIDLGPSKGMTEARRAILRQKLRPTVAIASSPSSIPGNGKVSARLARVGEAQDGINAQIRRLSSKVAALQESVTVQGRTARSPLPRTTQMTASNSVPPTVIASNGISPSAAASNTLPPRAAAAPSGILSSAAATAQTTLSWWGQSSWWKWPISAGLMLLLLAAAIVYRPRSLVQPGGTDDDKERISNILEEARVAAIPVLGEDSVPPEGNVYQSTPAPGATGNNFYAEAARTVADHSTSQIPSETVPHATSAPQNYPDIIDPSTLGVVNQGLKREMADALDGARSMFSDVDRFIVLGRAENAISMLEFQIETHPEDRDAWVKLMAIFEQEGMNDEFERTYTAFGEKFADA